MYRYNVMWELRASKTDELITTYDNKFLDDFEFAEQTEKIQKKIKEVVFSNPNFNNFDEESFDEWYYYITTIGINDDEEDYNSLDEFKKDENFDLYPLYFLKTIIKEEFNIIADYYTVQNIGGYEDSMIILASYKTFEEAEIYCKKYDISINNILPQNFGENFLDITDM